MTRQFDVFLCHNSTDKLAVVEIARQLQDKGIKPWLDIWEIQPGLDWQDLLEEQISHIKSAAVFVGNAGLGPWQNQEVKAFLREFVQRKCPVIPILLQSAPQEPVLPMFLKGKMWVDFRDKKSDPLGSLIWGITNCKPSLSMPQEFDVFLAYRSQDKPLIRQIYSELKARGLKPWFDEQEVVPGTHFKTELQQVIDQVRTAAIFFGKGEEGRWPVEELRSFIDLCFERTIRFIPVFLPGVKTISDDLLFIKEYHEVSFQNTLKDKRAFFLLEWGITGNKPTCERNIVSSELIDSGRFWKGTRYEDLELYLEGQKWQEADNETYRLMINAVGKRYGQWFDANLMNLPRDVLTTIDGLWVQHSEGKFGFSVQKEIYVEECGGIPDGKFYKESWNRFCHENGWQRDGIYLDIKFDISAPSGHLPICGGRRHWRRWGFLGDRYLFFLLSHPYL
jgi:hypothetical protein